MRPRAAFALPSFHSRQPPKMASERPSLCTFLRLPRPQTPAFVVLGNEASDLDSVASALGYAYLARTTPPSTPIINIPRSNLRLRRDVLLALTFSNISPDDLTFIDAMPNPTALALVDHNAPASHQAHLAQYVSAVVDHHADEHLFTHAEPRVVAQVGSCATLVSEIGEPDEDTARLLLCAIMTDCRNMEPGGKGTARDGDAVERLSRIARWDKRERNSVYSKLKAARKDISGFSVKDLLNKDMKVVETHGKRVAVCTVCVSAWDLADRGERLVNALSAFRSGMDLDCVIVMNSYGGKGGHRREICVLENELGVKIAQKLERENVLELSNVMIDGADGLACFRQGNVKASRKVVAPILKRVLGELEAIQQ